MELLSRAVPASSSAGVAAWAQDASYGGPLWGLHTCELGTQDLKGNGWVTYDLRGVPAEKRSTLLVAVYQGKGDQAYQLNIQSQIADNYPPSKADIADAYVLEGSTSPGGQWSTLVSVTGNPSPNRAHLVTGFSPYTFLRFRTTAAPRGCSVKMDVYDASGGVTDGVVFYGDSITSNEFGGGTYPPQWFSRGVNAAHPQAFPFVAGGGMPYMTARDAAVTLTLGNDPTYGDPAFDKGLVQPLARYHTDLRYAALVFGANDAQDQTLTQGFHDHYRAIVDYLRGLGQTVIVASPGWASDEPRRSNMPYLRAQIGYHLPGWAPGTFAAGDAVWNGSRAYWCTTGGTSVVGPSGTGSGIADGGTARWAYVPSLREDYLADPLVRGGPDLYQVFYGRTDLLQDGLHPNPAGDVVWKQAWVDWASGALY
jgi:hypothetical protein